MFRRLSTPIQIGHLKKLFNKLNPGIDEELIDWEATIGSHETYHESIEDFQSEYPQYNWEEKNEDPYAYQQFMSVRDQAEDLGYNILSDSELKRLRMEADKPKTVVNLKKSYIGESPEETVKRRQSDSFYDKIIEDVKEVPILLLSQRGHGKSSSLKTVVKRIKEANSDYIIKIFDVSQSWYHKAPVQYRQLVNGQQIHNIGDCVYEMGKLSNDARRVLVASIINQDYSKRYQMRVTDPEHFKTLPRILYIFEEANVYFGSYSFRKKDRYSAILEDFISVGRNYGLDAFLVATAEMGEISPSLRRRIARLYGRMESESDLNALKRKNKRAYEAVKEMPKYNFLYLDNGGYKTAHIKDEVTTTPADYNVITENNQVKPLGFWTQLFIGLLIGGAFTYLLLSST